MTSLIETFPTFLFLAVVLGFLSVRLVIEPIMALAVTPAADLTRIRVSFEGLQGLAGPVKRVVSVTRDGTNWPTNSSPAERLYTVVLADADGATEEREVRIALTLIGQGAMQVSGSPYIH